MRHYVPSEVVAYIDYVRDFVPKDGSGKEPPSFGVSREMRAVLLGLVNLAERVPEHLIIDNAALTDVICGVQAIRTVVREAEAQEDRARQLSGYPSLNPSAPGRPNPVVLIQQAFKRCLDEAPAPHIEPLPFVTDPELRRSLRSDLDAVERALVGCDWKGATVIGGAVIEALLLWAIQRKPQAEILSALDRLLDSSTLKRNPGLDPETWHLPDYIAVATDLKLIRDETAAQSRLLVGFRNLIHPGRAKRLGQACNRGTAHAAQAAIAFVIEDLK